MQDNTLSDQDLFERVAVHLLRQGKKSVVVHDGEYEGSCSYRGDNGTKCAVGCLIKDEFYHECLEQQSVVDPVVLNAVTQSLGGSPKIELLTALQRVHDRKPVEEWDYWLRHVAELFRLDYRPVEGYLAAA